MRRRTAIRYGTTLAVAFLAAVAGCAMPPLDRSVSPKPGPAADNPASQSAEGVKPVNPEYSCSLRKIDVSVWATTGLPLPAEIFHFQILRQQRIKCLR